jgi:hypothetical protein
MDVVAAAEGAAAKVTAVPNELTAMMTTARA